MRWEEESLSQLNGSLNIHTMVWEELAFDKAVKLYTAMKYIAAQINVIAMTRIRTPDPRVTYPTL